MATIRKRPAKTMSPSEVPGNLEETPAVRDADRAGGAKRKKAAAGAPPPMRELRPTSFDEQRIRDRAYAIWIAEGQPDGRDVEHWLLARGEIERDAA